MNKRYCFQSDEDGHWYMIPIEKRKLFDELLYDENDLECEKFSNEFDKMRLSMHVSNYSFIDVNEL